jgi:hypothetical protein
MDAQTANGNGKNSSNVQNDEEMDLDDLDDLDEGNDNPHVGNFSQLYGFLT